MSNITAKSADSNGQYSVRAVQSRMVAQLYIGEITNKDGPAGKLIVSLDPTSGFPRQLKEIKVIFTDRTNREENMDFLTELQRHDPSIRRSAEETTDPNFGVILQKDKLRESLVLLGFDMPSVDRVVRAVDQIIEHAKNERNVVADVMSRPSFPRDERKVGIQ